MVCSLPLKNDYCFHIVWYIVVSLYGIILYYFLYYILVFVPLILCILPRQQTDEQTCSTLAHSMQTTFYRRDKTNSFLQTQQSLEL